MAVEIFHQAAVRDHEQVSFFHFPEVGLRAIVAIHSTVLGPALGGVRMKSYCSETEAMADVMRLAEGMTYKNSLAGLHLGGGKACIIASRQRKNRRRAMLLKFGECVRSLSGNYVAAEDMGTSVDDIEIVKEVCPYVSGTSLDAGGGGDPSPWTAAGVFQGIVAACETCFGTGDLNSRTIAVEGLGHVGMHLTQLLTEAGAKVIATDIAPRALDVARAKYGVVVAAATEFYDKQCDIYAPCAVGQSVNSHTITRLKCKIIAGAANNQLSDASMHAAIMQRGILYCPDFVINAGGVINCASEMQPGGWNCQWTQEKVSGIYRTIHSVLERAQRENRFSELVALDMAKNRIACAAAGRLARFSEIARTPSSKLAAPLAP